MTSKYGSTILAAFASASRSEPNSWTESGRSSSEYSRNSRIVRPSPASCSCFATTLCMLVNSVTTRAAPILLHCSRRAGSLTPAIGARNALPEKRGSMKKRISKRYI